MEKVFIQKDKSNKYAFEVILWLWIISSGELGLQRPPRTDLVLVDSSLTLVVFSLTRLTLVDLQPVRSLKGARSCVTETFQWTWLVEDLLNVMLVRFHRSLRTTTLPEVGRVHQKEKEVFHSADIKVRDNHQLRVNWVQVALIVEMTKKGAGSAQLVVLKGGGVQVHIRQILSWLVFADKESPFSLLSLLSEHPFSINAAPGYNGLYLKTYNCCFNIGFKSVLLLVRSLWIVQCTMQWRRWLRSRLRCSRWTNNPKRFPNHRDVPLILIIDPSTPAL